MNPARVETEIDRLYELLERETHKLAALAEAQADAEVEHKAAHAAAFLRAEGPVAERDAQAVEAARLKLLARRRAEGSYQAKRELLSSIRAQLEMLRTMSANMRAVS